MKIILATKNKGKLQEIKKFILSENEWIEIVTMNQAGFKGNIDENGDTFDQNAMIKAETVFKVLKMPCLADDSGLSVKALQGRPGIHSARYGGDKLSWQEKNLKLLKEMQGVKEREAYFTCSLAFIFHLNLPPEKKIILDHESVLMNLNKLSHNTWVFKTEARVYGVINHEIKGEEGFGFDPIFYVPHLGQTFAELAIEKKNILSHRGIALKRFRKFLENNLYENRLEA